MQTLYFWHCYCQLTLLCYFFKYTKNLYLSNKVFDMVIYIGSANFRFTENNWASAAPDK